jgi:hypothetical protein
LEQKKRDARAAYLLQLMEADNNPGMIVEKPNMDFDIPKPAPVEPQKEDVQKILEESELFDNSVIEEQQQQQLLEQQNKQRLQRLIKEMKIKEKLGVISSSSESERLKYDLERRMKQGDYIKILRLVSLSSITILTCYSKRTQLPAFNMREEILNTIQSNQVVVITGETGMLPLNAIIVINVCIKYCFQGAEKQHKFHNLLWMIWYVLIHVVDRHDLLFSLNYRSFLAMVLHVI